MARIVLTNDIESDFNEAEFLVGSKDVLPTEKGVRQARTIAQCFSKRFPYSKNIIASDSARTKQIVNFMRMDLKNANFRFTDSLRERNFGVLTGTKICLDSSMFTESRICAEQGESVSQCKSRALSVIHHYDSEQPIVNIFISHPFLCQIITNALANKTITMIEDCWFQKGYAVVFETSPFFKIAESFMVLEST